MSLKTYRLIDLGLFSAFALIFEYIAVVGTYSLGISIFSVSLLLPIVLIVMMRWGLWAIIPLLVGTGSFILAIGRQIDLTTQNYLIYFIGNLFLLLNLLWFIKGKEKIRTNLYLSILYIASGCILLEVGRAIIALILGNDFLNVFIGFLGTDALSFVLAFIIVLITRKQNGIFEDQIHYLLRIQEEDKKGGSNEISC